jgi:hypothetical protein
MPTPVHFISLVLPFFSGYVIATDRPTKGLLPSFQIGLVMGVALVAIAMTVAVPIIAGLSLVWPSMGVQTALTVLLYIVLAAGAYTALVGSLGALYATYRWANATTHR